MQEIQFYLVDAFSDKNFGGNAAAVCPLSEWLADDVLLKMAQQHNQSETAFFVRTDEGYELRWFTTLAEINLCGHATLPLRTLFSNISTILRRRFSLAPVLLVSCGSPAMATG
jgi:PhzF family phenazine biosynthesis protein